MSNGFVEDKKKAQLFTNEMWSTIIARTGLAGIPAEKGRSRG
jgi:hypothetical protein